MSIREKTEKKVSVLRPINVFCLSSFYLPGFKSGGPVRTISAMVHNLSGNVHFKIFTTDRDLMDSEPYASIKVNTWNKIGNSEVYYAKRSKGFFFNLISLIKKTPHEVLYLNSFFDPAFTLMPLLARRIGLIPGRTTILAPRGEFSEGAIAIKSWKKTPFIFIAKAIGLYKNVIWHASSEYEAQDIRNIMNFPANSNNIHVASDLTLASPIKIEEKTETPSKFKICFVSRISPKKNLDYVLRILKKIDVPLEFDIYGPIDELVYWKTCEDLIRNTTNQVSVTYKGSAEHNKIREIFSQYNLFFFPTKGENYGHVIIESMLAGTPVLLSDRTPWRNLAHIGVGWDIPLTDEDAFVRAIEVCMQKSNSEYIVWKRKVQEYAIEKVSDKTAIEANKSLFINH